MNASVIAPLKNEEAGLEELIDALLDQLREGDELVIVETGSADATLEIANRRARGDSRIRIVRAPGAYPGAARNAGIATSRADIIAHIDGGNHPAEDWLERIRKPLEEGRADYVVGNVDVMPAPKRIAGVEFDMGVLFGASLYRGSSLRGKASAGKPAGGASVAYKREIWLKTGGFPEWLRFGSDPLYVEKLMRFNPRVEFAGDAVVFWQLGPGLCDFLKRHKRQVFKKFRNINSAKPYIGSAAMHLAIAVTLIVSIFQPLAGILFACLLGLVLARQSVKTWMECRARSEFSMLQAVYLPALIIILELTAVFARIQAVVSGILFLARHGGEMARKRQEYLNS